MQRKKETLLLISMYPLLRQLEDQESVQQILVQKMKTETQEEIKKQLS